MLKMANISGFDMGKTIEWYTQSEVKLPETSVESKIPYQIINPGRIELTGRELSGLYDLFPSQARERMIVSQIIGQRSSWFRKDSTTTQPIPTNNLEEALSPTAIIPSYIDYSEWRASGKPTANIWIYEIMKELAPHNIRKIIAGEGFLHELGHAIVQPAAYINDYKLKLPSGKEVFGLDCLMDLANIAEQAPPISHYASLYRGPTGHFDSPEEGYNLLTSISEEIVETIAALLIGFAYSGDDSISKNPFAHREEMKRATTDFLHAEKVN